MTQTYTHELEIATSIAHEAGAIMLEYFDGNQQVVTKQDGSPVTIADTTINSLVIERLTAAFPDDGIVGEEESTSSYGMGRKWLCDPIDGTKAFTWGLPTAMFSLGLIVDGVPKLGVAHDPFLNRLYTGVEGHGSFCNDQRLHVSSQSLAGGIVAVTSDVKRLASDVEYIAALTIRGAKPAMFSGAVYKSLLVARGRFVAYAESIVNPYDMAAVDVIVREAGGTITGMDGEPLDYSKTFNGAVVSNGVCHDELIAILKENR